jgi:hypothetical protein
MECMNPFQRCWDNWTRSGRLDKVPAADQVRLNELNQAVFRALEKNLEGRVRVLAVSSPAFLYFVDGPDGLESESACVETVTLGCAAQGSFGNQTQNLVDQIVRWVDHRSGKTAFVYSPVFVRCGGFSDAVDGRLYLAIRMKVVDRRAVL